MASARVIIRYDRLPQVAQRFPQATSTLVQEQVFESEGHVKTNIQKYGAIRTGFMLSSVQGQMAGAFSGEVTVGASYGPYVNFGTRYQSPRPFFSDETHRAESAFPARFKKLEGML